MTGYAGFDPTADSLHVGHLLPLLGLARPEASLSDVLAGTATAEDATVPFRLADRGASLEMDVMAAGQSSRHPAELLDSLPMGASRMLEGERLRGKFRTGGSDWQSLRSDGAISINVRLVMETDDGTLIAMRYRGVRHGPKEVIDRLARGEAVNPNDYYFRVTPWFETASAKYDWLNRIVAIAIGHRLPSGPVYNVFEIV